MNKVLKIVQCASHDYIAMLLDDKLIHQHDTCPESAIILAQSLGMEVELEMINRSEFEQRYA